MVGVAQRVVYENGAEYEGLPMYVFSEASTCHAISRSSYREMRNQLLEYAKPIAVGDDVWIGGGTVVTPGVKIGSDMVIGAGSVVTKDIPDHSVAYGNPCRVIRPITEADRKYRKE